MKKDTMDNPAKKSLTYVIIPWLVILFCMGYVIFCQETKLNELGDAMSGIWGTLISTITLIFVAYSFNLQKEAFIKQQEELDDTRKVLKGQEKAMKEQKLQSMIISLLELSQNHLNNFREVLAYKFSTTQGRDIISLYVQQTPDINLDTKDGILNSAIYYFRTLKHIETMIIKESLGNKSLLKDYIDLLESQITENLRTLHELILGSKSGKDKDKIMFEYLFTNKMLVVNSQESPNKKKPKTITRKIDNLV